MLTTPWGEALDEAHILPEYPRPQLRRDSYLNLNGRWEYAITEDDVQPQTYDGSILVPFSPESALSGVGRTLMPGQTLWYRRQLTLPDGFLPQGWRLLLHFGAVDQEAVVLLNGKEAGRHMGGYNAFVVELTALLRETNTLVVRVHDDTDASFHSRGKQSSRRGGIWYTPQSGIWQTVWLEAVPSRHIRSLRITPLFDESAVEITVAAPSGLHCEAVVDGRTVPFSSGEPTRIPLPDFRAWSPEDPFLYDLTVTMGEDRVQSYFGMRKTEVRADHAGVKRLFLNGEPYYQGRAHALVLPLRPSGHAGLAGYAQRRRPLPLFHRHPAAGYGPAPPRQPLPQLCARVGPGPCGIHGGAGRNGHPALQHALHCAMDAL